jgi:hypothetical protein
MKSTRETYEEELIRRLRHYSEEPQKDFWEVIAGKMASENQSSVVLSKKLGRQILGGLLAVALLFSFLYQESEQVQSASVYESLANTGALSERKQVELANERKSTEASVSQANPSVTELRNGTNKNESFRKSYAELKTSTHSANVNAVSYPENEPLITNTQRIEESLLPPDILTDPNSNSLSTPKSLTNPVQVEFKSLKPKRTIEQKKAERKRQEQLFNRFSMYINLMPTFGYQRIESNTNDNIIVESISKISAFSSDRLGIRAEVGAETPIARNLKVFGGLVYYQRKQTIGFTEKQVDSTYVVVGPGGEIIIQPEFVYVDRSFEYELKNLGVQIGLNYQFSKKKFLQTLGTGFEFQIALNKLSKENQFEGFTENPDAYVFYNLYYRLQYPSEGRFKAVFQPTLNYSFYINENLNAPFYVKPYGLGLNIGCTYNF